MSSPANMIVPSVLYTNDKAMMILMDDRTSFDPPTWMPVRVTLAALTTAKYGVLVSYPMGTDQDGDSTEDYILPIVIEPEASLVMDEFQLCVTFTDPKDWSQFKIRFKESEDYWSFTAAFAKVKLTIHPRQMDIMKAFQKVLSVELERAQGEIGRQHREIETLNMLVETFRRLWHFYHELSRSLEKILVPYLDERTTRELFPFRQDA
ncbi:hypothetical protein PYCCODRAFT_1467315 [Trametes coccinea BRFM310]|uniref:Uncharacterized protein n=1 Tax=Trametes coccinea (strain BRFM310) TaxID=1353009 RepID=A0A1Y2IPI7_TRAC3|nr:hypothetical protein PYCCODRAFT_1467315 [Trametes coccinea BRFM310]